MSAEQPDLTPAEVAERLERGEIDVVDVREPAERQAGHIAGTRHVQMPDLPTAGGDLGTDRPVVFYCRGGDRSTAAAEAFRASGREAYSMAGGLLAWVEEDRPIEPEDGTVGSPSMLPPR